MSKYIVSLTPLGKYFFGGDMTFKVSDKNDYNVTAATSFNPVNSPSRLPCLA